MSTSGSLLAAQQHQNAGRAVEAEAIYRQILAADPQNVDALHGFGWLACQVGRLDVALPLLEKALSSRPKDARLHLHFAMANDRAGRNKEADAAYRRACDLRPRDQHMLNAWGRFLMSRGERARGTAVFQRAVEADPNFAASHRNLGLAFEQNQQFGDAEAAFREWVRLEPHSADALLHLGRAVGQANRLDEAIDILNQAIQLDASNVEANYCLGVALRRQRRIEESLPRLQLAASATPMPPMALLELATNYADLGEHTTALALLDQVVATRPDDSEAHGARAQSLLSLGKYSEGWREYEWRWKARDFPHNRRYTHIPQWTGSDIAGKSILIHTEQGFGDCFQFARYVPLVSRLGATVLLQTNRGALRVLRTLDGVSEFFEHEEMVPRADFQCPLMSLPLAFKTTLETIPNQVPYLHAEPGKIELWKPRLATPAGGRKIGLFWAGRANTLRNAERSIPPGMLASLGSVPDTQFFSLQKGKGSDDAVDGLELIRLGPDLKDFADTAAVVSQLDLLISIDTGVVHLAGALGKPVWTLLSVASDFRWMLDREDSPWYPTMRLFRQKRRGDWGDVIERVVAELK